MKWFQQPIGWIHRCSVWRTSPSFFSFIFSCHQTFLKMSTSRKEEEKKNQHKRTQKNNNWQSKQKLHLTNYTHSLYTSVQMWKSWNEASHTHTHTTNFAFHIKRILNQRHQFNFCAPKEQKEEKKISFGNYIFKNVF